jgi:hypothetical protein
MLDKDILASMIQAELTAVGFKLPNAAYTIKFCEAIAKAVVEHIQTASQVISGEAGLKVV